MAKFASYTLKYLDLSKDYRNDLFSGDPDFNMTKFWANRQQYLAELFASDDVMKFVVGDKKTYPHKLFHCSLNEKIIIMRFANVKEMLLERNFVEEPVVYNPSCYVIIDNRDGCRRVVIQKVSTAFTTTDQVAKVMEQVLSEQLKSKCIGVELLANRYPRDFYKLWKMQAHRTSALKFNVSDFSIRDDDDMTNTQMLIALEEGGRDLDANASVEFTSRIPKGVLRLNEKSSRVRALVRASAKSAVPIELITTDGARFECYIDTDLESDDKIVTEEFDSDILDLLMDKDKKVIAERHIVEFLNRIKVEEDKEGKTA